MKKRVLSALRRARLKPVRKPPFIVRLHPYKGRERMLSLLGPGLSTTTDWRISAPEPTGELAEIFSRSGGAFKWVHYLPIYEKAVPRLTPIRLLEIGVFRGGSLHMWREYLHPESTVVGIDINADCRAYDRPDQNVHVRIGSQDNEHFLRSVVAEFGPFDVIIDDGSHMATHTIKAFRELFHSGLRDDGSYIVEDLHCSYWTSYRDSKVSFVDFVAVLIDAMHAHYHDGWPGDMSRNASSNVEPAAVPALTPLLGSIEVFDSVVVVHKSNRELPRVVLR